MSFVVLLRGLRGLLFSRIDPTMVYCLIWISLIPCVCLQMPRFRDLAYPNLYFIQSSEQLILDLESLAQLTDSLASVKAVSDDSAQAQSTQIIALHIKGMQVSLQLQLRQVFLSLSLNSYPICRLSRSRILAALPNTNALHSSSAPPSLQLSPPSSNLPPPSPLVSS